MVVWECDQGEVGELRDHVCVSSWARSVRAAHERWADEHGKRWVVSRDIATKTMIIGDYRLLHKEKAKAKIT